MGRSVFQFKQFTIQQDRCAMKVGTDGVLLGAWASVHSNAQQILDVGTGTGLIALMLAQRFPKANISGIEINPEAAKQARENAVHSPFSDRVEIIHSDIFHWKTSQKFDLIVCNPPFYEYAHPSKTTERDTARHGHSFNLNQFLSSCSQLISNGGTLALILPRHVHEEQEYSNFDWHIHRICTVFPNPQKEAHRIMVELQKRKSKKVSENISIEINGRHQYSPEYSELTSEFYLKM